MKPEHSKIAKIMWENLTYKDCSCNATVIEMKDVWKTIHKLENNTTDLPEFLEWLTDETTYNIPKDEIKEIIQDWQYYKANS